MLAKPLDEVTEIDLVRLVEDGVSEDIQLEYKLEFPSFHGEQKYDLLADWTAMANTDGGDILYGVREERGLPIELIGLDVSDFDVLKQQLLNKVLDGVKPQLSSIRLAEVKLKNGRSVVLVRIPKSWCAPHRVTLSRHGHFYARSPSGNYQLDVDGLRIAFTAANAAGERVKNFVAERLVRIKAGKAPVRLSKCGRMVLHVVPLGIQVFDQQKLTRAKEHFRNVELMLGYVGQTRFNLDGCVSSDGGRGDDCGGYLQCFRDGALEWVGPLLGRSATRQELIGGALVPEINRALKASAEIYRICDIVPPFAVILSFLGVADYGLVSAGYTSRYPCGEDDFTLPDVLIENSDFNVVQILRPTYDALWNAFGFEKCPDDFLRT